MESKQERVMYKKNGEYLKNNKFLWISQEKNYTNVSEASLRWLKCVEQHHDE